MSQTVIEMVSKQLGKPITVLTKDSSNEVIQSAIDRGDIICFEDIDSFPQEFKFPDISTILKDDKHA